MPNHCENILGVMGKTEDVIEFINFITVKSDEGIDEYKIFKSLSPLPEELTNTSFPQSVNEEFKLKYGFDNWYEWCCANWGTKWGDYDNNTSGIESSNITSFSFLENGEIDEGNMITNLTGESSIHFNYQTAWSPGNEFLSKQLSEKFPKLIFWLYYEEPGMCFAGEDRIYKGNIVFSDSWDFHPKYESITDIYWEEYESDYPQTKELEA